MYSGIVFYIIDSNTDEKIYNIEGKISINLIVANEKEESILESDVLFKSRFISASEESEQPGIVEINITDFINGDRFKSYFEKYNKNYSINLKLIITIDKTDYYYSYIGKTIISKITYSVYENGEIEIGKMKDNNNVYLISTQNAFSAADLKTKLKEAEDAYNLLKIDYENKIKYAEPILVTKANDYEPESINNVITRLLELNVGTIEPGITYCQEFKLRDELRALQSIQRSISYLSGLYPGLTIDDGEGIPYQPV